MPKNCINEFSNTGPTRSTWTRRIKVKRALHTQLDLMRPDLRIEVNKKQADQKVVHDRHSRDWQYFLGQNVMVKDIQTGFSWIPGIIIERLGPLSYLVMLEDGRIRKRHVDHIREVAEQTLNKETATPLEVAHSNK